MLHTPPADQILNIKPFPSHQGSDIRRITAVSYKGENASENIRNRPEAARAHPITIINILFDLFGNPIPRIHTSITSQSVSVLRPTAAKKAEYLSLSD